MQPRNVEVARRALEVARTILKSDDKRPQKVWAKEVGLHESTISAAMTLLANATEDEIRWIEEGKVGFGTVRRYINMGYDAAKRVRLLHDPNSRDNNGKLPRPQMSQTGRVVAQRLADEQAAKRPRTRKANGSVPTPELEQAVRLLMARTCIVTPAGAAELLLGNVSPTALDTLALWLMEVSEALRSWPACKRANNSEWLNPIL